MHSRPSQERPEGRVREAAEEKLDLEEKRKRRSGEFGREREFRRERVNNSDCKYQDGGELRLK